MVYLLAGPKGTGKTQQMIEQANEGCEKMQWKMLYLSKKNTPRYSKCNI